MEFERRVLAALECPSDWTWLITEADASHVGILDWLYWCHEVAVSADEEVVISEFAKGSLSLDPDNFSPEIALNLEASRQRAEEKYNDNVGKLFRLPFVPPSVQKKHFIPGLSRSAVTDRSKKGVSYFFRDYTAAELRWAFWYWLTDYYDPTRIVDDPHLKNDLKQYRDMISGHDCINEIRRTSWLQMRDGARKRIAFDTRSEIGASNGQPTTCVCFDVGTVNIHAYPVSASQAASLMEPDILWTSKGLW